MGLIDDAHAGISEGDALFDLPRLGDRPIEIAFLEGIRKALFEAREGFGPAVDRNGPTDCLGDRPQFVDAVDVVAMVMGCNDGMETIDIRIEQLLAQVRAAIDQNPFAIAFDEDRRTEPSVARLFRIALTPLISDLGN